MHTSLPKHLSHYNLLKCFFFFFLGNIIISPWEESEQLTRGQRTPFYIELRILMLLTLIFMNLVTPQPQCLEIISRTTLNEVIENCSLHAWRHCYSGSGKFMFIISLFPLLYYKLFSKITQRLITCDTETAGLCLHTNSVYVQVLATFIITQQHLHTINVKDPACIIYCTSLFIHVFCIVLGICSCRKRESHYLCNVYSRCYNRTRKDLLSWSKTFIYTRILRSRK